MSDSIHDHINSFHRFDIYHENNLSNYSDLVNKPYLVGLKPEDLNNKKDEQQMQMILGEYFALVAKQASKIAADLLFRVHWTGKESEWYDHRLHLLDTDRWFTDFWSASADNVLKVLPLRGKLLNLCSGDGFYDYFFYRKRASEICGVELDDEPFRHANRLHGAGNITYVKHNVLTYEPREAYYDTVVIRGAIEHFSRENQDAIIGKAYKALKVGGWFCGDTPAKMQGGGKHLSMHEYEWADETEMRQILVKYFDHVETSTLVSDAVTTLFWRCQRIK